MITGCISPKFSIEKINNRKIYKLVYDNIGTDDRISQIGKVPLEITHEEGSLYTFYKLTSTTINDWTKFYMRSKKKSIEPIECMAENSQFICKFNKNHIKDIDLSSKLDLVLSTKSGINMKTIVTPASIGAIEYCKVVARQQARFNGQDPTHNYIQCVNASRDSKIVVTGGTGIDTSFNPSSKLHRELKKFKEAIL